MSLRCSLILLASLSGCSLARAPIVDLPDSPMDGGGFDAGFDGGFDANLDTSGFDGGAFDAGFDTGTDAGMADTGMRDAGVDAGMPDAGVDAGMPDAGVDAPAPRATCADLFGGPNRTLCPAPDDTHCQVYVDRPGMDEVCDAVCGGVSGSTCTGASRTDGDCTSTGGSMCNSPGNDRICTCTRP